MAAKGAKSVAASQFLPLDIVAEILSRLPVKSLFRFRCVCKQWNSLTYDPHLVSKHLYRAPSKLIFVPRRIGYSDIKLYDFLKDGTLAMHSSYKIRVEQQGLYFKSNIVHGLMCAYNCDYTDYYICLLNPFTREFAQLPLRNNPSRRHGDTFGFGYDDTTGKYKLVRLFLPPNYPEDTNQHCEILTLGSKEWRYLGEVDVVYIDVSYDTITDAVYVDGVIYWKGDGLAVLSFDIKQEKFAIILGPPGTLVDNPDLFSSLYGSGGHLYLMYGRYNSLNFKIWLLKDFATGLWIDLYDIDVSSGVKSYGYVTILSIEDKKVQLVLTEYIDCAKWANAILSYDTCSKTFLKLYDEESDYIWFHLCSESLISPRKLTGNVL